MTTFTVYSSANGTVYGRGLTAIEAAEIILTHDGANYEVRRVKYGWRLFVTSADRRRMTECYSDNRFIASTEDEEAAAREDIALQVCRASWLGDRGHLDLSTDADYDAMAENE